MNVKELKQIIANKPDDMPVGLLDVTTDDFDDSNYPLTVCNFLVSEYVKEEGDDVAGKMLFICFENKLNENPIQLKEAPLKVNTTVGLYSNGEYKVNGVLEPFLNRHIEYNRNHRAGRALFVNGTCVYNGSCEESLIESFTAKIKDNPVFIRTIDTMPYE